MDQIFFWLNQKQGRSDALDFKIPVKFLNMGYRVIWYGSYRMAYIIEVIHRLLIINLDLFWVKFIDILPSLCQITLQV